MISQMGKFLPSESIGWIGLLPNMDPWRGLIRNTLHYYDNRTVPSLGMNLKVFTLLTTHIISDMKVMSARL